MAEEEIVMKISLEGATEELNNLTKLKTAVNELAAQKKEYNSEQKELTSTLADLNTEYEALNATEKEHEEIGGALDEQIKAQEQSIVDLTAQQVQLGIETKETTTEFREAEKAVIDNEKANNANEGSIAQMRVELAAAQREYVGLSEEQRNNEEVGGSLQASISAQSDELKALEKDIGITSRSVGDYGTAIDGALGSMGPFGKQIQSVVGQLGSIKTAVLGFTGAQKASTAATTGSSKALRLFKIALISTGVGAIVVALGSLIAAFLGTQRGMDATTRALAPLKEIFQQFIGFLETRAFAALDRLKEAIDNPKQAFIDLGIAIKDRFVNRFKGALGIVKSVAQLHIGIFKLMGLQIKKALSNVPLIGDKLIDKAQLVKDLAEAKKEVLDATKDLANQSLQTVTGIEDAGKKLAAVYNSTAESAKIAADRAEKMFQLTQKVRTAEINIGRQRALSNKLIEEQRAILQDTSKTDDELLAASKLATAEVKKITNLELGILDLKIKNLKFSQEANDTDAEGQKELQDLIGQRIQKEADGQKQTTRLSVQAFTVKKRQQDKATSEAKKLQKELAKEDQDELTKKVKTLELERQLELTIVDETNAEKLKKEQELLEKITALKLDSATKIATALAEKQTAGIKDEVKREEEKQNIIDEALSTLKLENKVAFAEKEKEIDDEKKERDAEELATKEEEDAQKLTESEEAKQAITDSFVEAGQTVQKEVFNNQNRRIDEGLSRDIEALNAKRQAGEISEEEFNKKRLALDKKAFSERKRLSLAQVAIDFAVAAGKTLASTGAAGFPLLIPLAVQAAVQAGIIASQTFARGGIIHGASHANGGVQLGNNQEAEGGEAIINKRSTAKHKGLLSAINQDGGGVSFSNSPSPNLSTVTAKFANGGIAASGGGTNLDINDLRAAFSESMSTIQVQNVASETTGVANRVQQIEDSASF